MQKRVYAEVIMQMPARHYYTVILRTGGITLTGSSIRSSGIVRARGMRAILNHIILSKRRQGMSLFQVSIRNGKLFYGDGIAPNYKLQDQWSNG